MNSREKGKRGERELALRLREIGFEGARRGQQYDGLGGEDVVGLPGLHVECKYGVANVPKAVYAAISQSLWDSDPDAMPLAMMRRVARGEPRRRWLVVSYLDLFEAVAVRYLRGLGYSVRVPDGRQFPGPEQFPHGRIS